MTFWDKHFEKILFLILIMFFTGMALWVHKKDDSNTKLEYALVGGISASLNSITFLSNRTRSNLSQRSSDPPPVSTPQPQPTQEVKTP